MPNNPSGKYDIDEWDAVASVLSDGVPAISADDLRTTTLNTIQVGRQNADNPDAAGTEADPWRNAIKNVLASETLPVHIELQDGWFTEPNAPFTVTDALVITGPGRAARPLDKTPLCVVETTSGNGLLEIDNSGGNHSAAQGHIEGFWLHQGAEDGTGTGIHLNEAHRWTIDNLGVSNFDTGIHIDGGLETHLGPGVYGLDNATHVRLTRSATRGISPNVNKIEGVSRGGVGTHALRQQTGIRNDYRVTVESNDQHGLTIEDGGVTAVSGYFEANNAGAKADGHDILVNGHNYGLNINSVRTTGADVTASLSLDDLNTAIIDSCFFADTNTVSVETTANTTTVYERSTRLNGSESIANWRDYHRDVFGNDLGTTGLYSANRKGVPEFDTELVDVRDISNPANGDVAFHDGSGSAARGLAIYFNGWEVFDSSTAP